MKKTNFNLYQLINDGNSKDKFLDNSITGSKKQIQVIFRNIDEILIKEIKKADVVLGCVAWLTQPEIIDALSKKRVSIIVQKEDFLRPDVGEKMKSWKKTLRERYNKLKSGLDRCMFDNILNKTSVCTDLSIEPVRCVGNYNRKKAPAFPRMHNKFLIFAKIKPYKQKIGDETIEFLKVIPYAVWTGSFNLTQTATQSLENAIIIKKREIVNAYFSEYGQICAMSEPLDWEHDWVEPEWRIGT